MKNSESISTQDFNFGALCTSLLNICDNNNLSVQIEFDEEDWVNYASIGDGQEQLYVVGVNVFNEVVLDSDGYELIFEDFGIYAQQAILLQMQKKLVAMQNVPITTEPDSNEWLNNLDMSRDQHLMSIMPTNAEGKCYLKGHVEIVNGKITTSGDIGEHTYENFVALIHGLWGKGIKIDDFYF